MARTTLTVTTMLGAYGAYTAGTADVTMTAADVGNMNQFALYRGDIVIAQNTGGVAYTVTFTSIADPYGRTKDITTYSLDASDICVFGPFQDAGWKQSDGMLYLQASNAGVKFGILRQPS